MPKIIGLEPKEFTPANASTPIKGINIYLTEPIPPTHGGQGNSAERIFLSKAKAEALDFTPAVGQVVTILYNRYGKVAALQLKEADVDFGMDDVN